MLPKTLQYAGVNATMYTAHGFHAGRVLEMLELGIPVETIKKLGHWKSNAVYTYLAY